MEYKLSPTSLNVFEDCPRCFWLHQNEGIRRPDTPFPSIGLGLDHVLKEHFDYYKNRLPPELQGLNVQLFQNSELLEEWRNPRRGLVYEDSKGNVLRGAVDTVLESGDKLIVLDYKTRGFPVKEDTPGYYKLQLELYNFLLRKNGYNTEDYAYLLFYIPRSVRRRSGDIVFNTNLVKVQTSVRHAQQVWSAALETLQQPMPEPSESCEFCKHYAKLENIFQKK